MACGTQWLSIWFFTSPTSLPPIDIANPPFTVPGGGGWGGGVGPHKPEVECSRTVASAAAVTWGGSAARWVPGERVDLKRDKRDSGKSTLGEMGGAKRKWVGLKKDERRL